MWLIDLLMFEGRIVGIFVENLPFSRILHQQYPKVDGEGYIKTVM